MSSIRPAYYNEIEPFPCAVLRARIADGSLPAGDVDERDIRLVQPDELRGYGQVHLFAGIGGGALACRLAGLADDFPIVTAGPPCQPASVAGNRLGESDERWLWPEVIRLLSDRVLRRYVALAENPTGILTLADGGAFAGILAALAEMGRDAEWSCVSAADVGASHERERIWLVVSRPAVADAGCGRVQPLDLAGAVGGAPSEDGGEGVQRERWSAAAPGGGADGVARALADADGEQRWSEPLGSDVVSERRRARAEPAGCGAGEVADSDSGSRSSGSRRSAVGDGEEGSRSGNPSDEVGDADRAGCEELHAPALAAGSGLDSGPAATDGPLADGDRAGCEPFAAPHGKHRGVDVEHRNDADGCGDRGDGEMGRATDGGWLGARPSEPALDGAVDGVPAYLGGDQWPAPPGFPQHAWEEDRLVPNLGVSERKAIAAYGNAWVPQAAVPALLRIRAGIERGDF